MKKVLCITVMLLSFFIVPHTLKANTITDIWATQDAQVTPYEYQYLYKHAGVAAYVYTDYTIDLQQKMPITFKLVKKEKTFIIVEHWLSHMSTMITEKGLLVSYYPKLKSPNDALASISMNKTDRKHILGTLNDATQGFINTPISKAAMLNFEHLEDNHLFMVASTEANVTFPADALISTVAAVSYFPNAQIINPTVFTPGITQRVDFNTQRLLNTPITLNSAVANYFISYKASEPLTFENVDNCCSLRYSAFKLHNHFKPIFKDVKTSDWFLEDISWAVLRGMIQGYEDGTFLPMNQLTESQFVSLVTKYYGVKTMAQSNEYNMLNAYSYFNQILPLDGWKTPAKRYQPITRGQVAQLLSATIGGPKDQTGAIRYLISQKLSTVNSVEAFNANNPINRGQISAFFKRMDDAGFRQLKK